MEAEWAMRGKSVGKGAEGGVGRRAHCIRLDCVSLNGFQPRADGRALLRPGGDHTLDPQRDLSADGERSMSELEAKWGHVRERMRRSGRSPQTKAMLKAAIDRVGQESPRVGVRARWTSSAAASVMCGPP